MIETTNLHPNENKIKLETDSQTVKSFSKIMSGKILDEEELTCSLLIFADKFDMFYLMDKISDFLKTTIDHDNLEERASAARLIEDGPLLQACAKFFLRNLSNPNGKTIEFEDETLERDLMNLLLKRKKLH